MGDRAIIPDKLYFKIGEVTEISGVAAHVLRYWESEFKIIRPFRASSKQRLYRRIDVENILRIRKLLYDEGYTIPGARKYLSKKTEAQREDAPAVVVTREEKHTLFEQIRDELEDIKKLLEEEGERDQDS